MAIYVTETRKISGVGSIRVPDNADIRLAILQITVQRFPTQRYRNFNWNPPRERFAYLTWREDGVVIRSESMEWIEQAWYTYADPGGQALVATQCLLKYIRSAFGSLANGIGAPVLALPNPIGAMQRLTIPFDEVVVSCHADTALQVSMIVLPYDNCGLESGSPAPPPIFPLPPNLAPPGTPIEVSPPYDYDDQEEPYNPNDLDTVPPPPPPPPQEEGGQCQRWRLSISTSINGAAPVTSQPLIFAPFIRAVSMIANGVNVGASWTAPAQPSNASYTISFIVKCRGAEVGAPCGVFQDYALPFTRNIGAGQSITVQISNAVVV